MDICNDGIKAIVAQTASVLAPITAIALWQIEKCIPTTPHPPTPTTKISGPNLWNL